jgi:8-oxo-dGTP pyrophosphatase MutT (NUDIX family)
MHNTDEQGYEKRPRAGLIPYMLGEDGQLRYLMMVSSDPKFGGPRPMISKGKIEKGETKLQAAVREAQEELGFKLRNACGSLKLVTEERVTLPSGTYDIAVFGVEIMDRYDFDKWCSETEFTVWMSLESFKTKGRKDHVKYIEQLEEMLK